MGKNPLSMVEEFLKGLLEAVTKLNRISTRRGKVVADDLPPPRKRGRKAKAEKKASVKPKPAKRGRKAKSVKAIKKATPRKAGRKPKAGIPKLPPSREIFRFLYGKTDGEKITSISRYFGIPRNQLKPLLKKLAKAGDIDELKGTFYLRRRIRGMEPAKEKGPEPVTPEQVLAFLDQNPGATGSEITAGLGEKRYQRLNKVISGLKKEGLVVPDGKKYFLAHQLS